MDSGEPCSIVTKKNGTLTTLNEREAKDEDEERMFA